MKPKNYPQINELMERREFLENLLTKIKKCIKDNENNGVYLPAFVEVSTYNERFDVEAGEVHRDMIGAFIIGYGVVVEKEINRIDKKLDKL